MFPRKELFNWLRDHVLNGRAESARLIADIEIKFIFDALDKVPGHGLDKKKIAAMFEDKIQKTKIANSIPYENVIKLYKNKDDDEETFTGKGFTASGVIQRDLTFHKKHSLSKSVWDTVNHTEADILNLVRGSIAQGRDIRSVSGDLMAYMAGGPAAVKGRWGKLIPGTEEYSKRLGGSKMDWRAMRLYRSEKYRQLQESAIEDGKNNPACTGLYDWVLMPGRENWNCDCPEVAAAGPYRADNIPEYRHPNCFIPKTKVITANGEKAIEKIILGEYVLCGDGKYHQVIGKMASKYDGTIYQLVTTARKSGWSTYNHSYKSGNNWVSAESLNKGDNVICISGSALNRLSGKTISKNNPSTLNKESSFCIVMDYFSATVMPITAVYFDGKFYIGESKVNIVDALGKIGNWNKTKLDEFFIQSGLINRKKEPFLTLGAFLKIVFRTCHSTNSQMSRFGIWFVTVLMRSMLTFCKSSFSIPIKIKQPVCSGSGDSKSIRHLIYREVFFFIKGANNFKTNIISFRHDVILSKNQSHYNGIVWNITVEGEHNYFANKFLVKNCDCVIEPRLKDADEFIQQLRDYVNGEDSLGASEIEQWALGNGFKDETTSFSISPGGSDIYEDTTNDDAEIRDKLVREMFDRDIDADFNESAKETIDYIPELHDKIVQDIPEIKEYLDHIRFTTSKDILEKDAGAGYTGGVFNIIHYDRLIFKSKENLIKYITKNGPGWFSSNELSSVIAHEYGHILYRLIKEKNKYNDKQMINLVNALLDKFGLVSDSLIIENISEYALKRDEVIPEIIAEVYTRKKQRQYSQNILNALLSLLRR